MCRERVVNRDFDGQDHAVIDVVALLQRSSSPLRVGTEHNLLKIVQPPAVTALPDCSRCVSPPRQRLRTYTILNQLSERHINFVTHHGDRPLFAVLGNELISQFFSFAKKAVALFSIPRSIRRRRFSFRRRSSSSCSLSERPDNAEADFPYFLRHVRSRF